MAEGGVGVRERVVGGGREDAGIERGDRGGKLGEGG